MPLHDTLMLSEHLSRLVTNPTDQALIRAMVAGLDAKYALKVKIERESGVADIIAQFTQRLLKAYGILSHMRGHRILDIACGSNSSKAPPQLEIGYADTRGYTALFEPWFCRMLLELDTQPVGIDGGDLTSEVFEHYSADLGQIGALDFLPAASFDAVQDSRLFGSPEFTAQFPERGDRIRIAVEIVRQEERVLKQTGIVIHSDARSLI